MSSMNRSSGGAGARPMYSTYSWWPTRVHFAMEIERRLGYRADECARSDLDAARTPYSSHVNTRLRDRRAPGREDLVDERLGLWRHPGQHLVQRSPGADLVNHRPDDLLLAGRRGGAEQVAPEQFIVERKAQPGPGRVHGTARVTRRPPQPG